MSAENKLISGVDFSLKQIKKRLIKMKIPFNPSIRDKTYYINKYNEAIKDENNIKLIKEEINLDNIMRINNLRRIYDKSNNQSYNNPYEYQKENEKEHTMTNLNPFINFSENEQLNETKNLIPFSPEIKKTDSKKSHKKSTIRIDNLTEIKLIKEPSEFSLNYLSEKNEDNGNEIKQYAQSSKISRVFREENNEGNIINLRPIKIRDSLDYNHQKINHSFFHYNKQNELNEKNKRKTMNIPLNINYNSSEKKTIENKKFSVPNHFNLRNANQNSLENNNYKIIEYTFKKENDISPKDNKNKNNNVNHNIVNFQKTKVEKRSISDNNFRRLTISSPYEINNNNCGNNEEQINLSFHKEHLKPIKQKKVHFSDEAVNRSYTNINDIKLKKPRKSNLIKHRNSYDNINMFNLNNLNKQNNFQIYETLINDSRNKKKYLNSYKENNEEESTCNSSSNNSSNKNQNKVLKNFPSSLPLSPIKEINSQKKDSTNQSINDKNNTNNNNSNQGEYFNFVENIKNGLKEKEIINDHERNNKTFNNYINNNNNLSNHFKQSLIYDKMNENNIFYNELERENLSPINNNMNNTSMNYDIFQKDFSNLQIQLNRTQPILDEINTSSNQIYLNMNNSYDNNINFQNFNNENRRRTFDNRKSFIKWNELISNNNLNIMNNNNNQKYINNNNYPNNNNNIKRNNNSQSMINNNDIQNFMNNNNNFENENENYENKNNYIKYNYVKNINPRYNKPQSIYNNGPSHLILNNEEQNYNCDITYSLLIGGFSIGAICLCYYYCLKNHIFFNRNENSFPNDEMSFNDFLEFIFSPFKALYIVITNPKKYIFDNFIVLSKNIIKILFWDYLKVTLGIFIISSVSYSLYYKYKENCLIEKTFDDIKIELKKIYENNCSNEQVENSFENGLSEIEIAKKYHERFNLSYEAFLLKILPKLRIKRKKDFKIKYFENIINGRKQLIWQWNPY